MSCNHCAAASAKAAAKAGHPAVEAGWADNRNFIGICPVCRNCFLRRDGGCTKCENGLAAMAQKNPARFVAGYGARDYPPRVLTELAPVMAEVEDDHARAVAAKYLTDAAPLEKLSGDEVIEVQAAVAGNVHTPATTLHRLLTSAERAVYRAAANNPTLPRSAVEQAAKETNEKWLNLVRTAMQPLLMSGRKGRGSWIVIAMVVGMYGQDAYRCWRRKRDLDMALKNRPEPEPAVKTATPAIPQPKPHPGAADARLNEAERQALREELKIFQSSLTMAEDYYDGQITMADVARIETEGAVTDREAEISGYILEKARETAVNFPDWHEGLTEQDFSRMQEKLRCKKCGLYAGSRDHTCGYPPHLTLDEPAVAPAPDGVDPVDVYQTN